MGTIKTGKLTYYCIYLPGLKISEDYAERCVKSAEKHGETVVLYPGTPYFEARKKLSDFGITWPDKIRDTYAGAFCAHYELWLKAQAGTIGILEHDAVFVSPVPDIPLHFRDVINLQESEWHDPRWKYHEKVANKLRDKTVTEKGIGIIPCEFTCLPCSSGYAIGARAARDLVYSAQHSVAQHSDRFVNKLRVNLFDLWPFPIHTKGDVSTIVSKTAWSHYVPVAPDQKPE